MKLKLMRLLHKIQSILTIKIKGKAFVPSFGLDSVFPSLMFLGTVVFWCLMAGTSFSGFLGVEGAVHQTFMILFTISLFLAFLDTIYRHSVSHVLVIAINGILVAAYSLTIGVSLITTSNLSIGGGVFYVIGGSLAAISVIFYLMKAFNGDADWKFMLSVWATAIAILFGVSFSYSILETYSHFGDMPFWTGMMSGMFALLSSIMASFLSASSDYDPHPSEIDEFGNTVAPIGESE